MEWISDWIRQIVLVIFIATFIDLLLPSSSLERYVKLVMGLIIIVAILQPILQLVVQEEKWTALLTPVYSIDDGETLVKIQETKGQLTNVQQKEVKEQLQESIQDWIEKQVPQKYKVKVVSAKVTADLQQETPVIQKIEVQGVIVPAEENVQPIEPVDVLKGETTLEQTEQVKSMQQAIQSFIGSSWNLEAEQVSVHIHSS